MNSGLWVSFSFRVMVLSVWLGWSLGVQSAAPPNDNFAARTLLQGTSLLITAKHTGATSETGEPIHVSGSYTQSLWWSWQAPCDGSAKFEVTDSLGVALAVYTGDALTNLSPVASQAGYRFAQEIPTRAGQVYAIALAAGPSLLGYPTTLRLTTPGLYFTQPATNQHISIGIPVELAVDTVIQTQSLLRVDYYAGTSWIGSSTQAPFGIMWVPAALGSISLKAVGTNLLGERLESPPQAFTVGPANDDFANAFVIDPETIQTNVVGYTTYATREEGEPPAQGNLQFASLWWRWTPRYSGQAQFGPTSAAALDLFVGESLTNLAALTNLGSTTRPVYELSAGTTYWLVLQGGSFSMVQAQWKLQTLSVGVPQGDRLLAGQTGTIRAVNFEDDHELTWAAFKLGTKTVAVLDAPPWEIAWGTNTPGFYNWIIEATNSLGQRRMSDLKRLRVAPVNDDFAAALVVPSLPYGPNVAESFLNAATYEPGEPRGASFSGSVWLTWVSPVSAEATFAMTSGQRVVYQGEAVTNLVALTPRTNTAAMVRVTEGQRYYLSVESSSLYAELAQLTIYLPPANDDFLQALELTEASGTFAGTNTSASLEPGEPALAPEDRSSIWWRWTAPATGDFKFDLKDTLVSKLWMGGYFGEGVSHLTAVLESTNADGRSFWFRAYAGRTYWLRFSGAPVGRIGGNYWFTPMEQIPGNDNFADRQWIAGETNYVGGNCSQASREPGEPSLESCTTKGRSLWWSYEAPGDGVVRVQSSGAALGVFRGQTLGGLQLAVTSCAAPAFIVVTQAEVLQLVVDAFLFSSGQVQLETRFFPRPLNDRFTNSLHLEGTNVTLWGATMGASTEAGEPQPEPSGANQSVWYSWAAPVTGRVIVEVWSPAEEAPGVTLYTGPTMGRLTRVHTAGDYFARGVSFLAEAGTVYHFQVVDELPGTEFQLVFRVEPLLPASNDSFKNAPWLSDGQVGFSDATLEPGEPAHWEGMPCKSVWWQWTTPLRGLLMLNVQSSLAPEVVFAVCTGGYVEALSLLGKGTNYLEVPVGPFTTYHIALAAPAGAEGDLYLRPGFKPYSGPSIPVPGNVLENPGFEVFGFFGSAWQHSPPDYMAYGNAPGGPDGYNCIALPGVTKLWQDFPTVPGREYQVRFAYRADYNATDVALAVRWDGQELGQARTPADKAYQWQWVTMTATATKTDSRLLVEILSGGYTALDAFSVVWNSEAPAIVTQPVPARTFSGATARFWVAASGSAPLSYQWFHDGAPIVGQKSSVLVLDPVAPGQAGGYSVTVSNRMGSVTSAPVSLTVEIPDHPTLVLQPHGDRVPAGSFYALTVAAVGTPPLFYQWYRNGAPLPSETNQFLTFASIQKTNEGVYCAKVWNLAEAVWSLEARLSVEPVVGDGAILCFANQFEMGHGYTQALVDDLDGVTPLSGSRFAAQLYAGPTLDQLRAIGEPVPFRSGFFAGLISEQFVQVPSVAPGAVAFVQMRAWQRDQGPTYEVARALGGKFGRSEIFQVATDSRYIAALTPLKSFSLSAGLPRFTVGQIRLGERNTDGKLVWELTGEAGFQYVIEATSDFSEWRPILVLTNTTGTHTFTDPGAVSTNAAAYRSRILD